MNTCKTCRWWNADTIPDTDHRVCKHPKMGCEWKEKDTLASIWDDIRIFTGPDFGCIHYEEKK
jgi:hypothetical protein